MIGDKKKKVLMLAISALLVLGVGAGVALASNQGNKAADSKPVDVQKVSGDVSLTLIAEGADTALTPAIIKIHSGDKHEDVDGIELVVGENKLGTLEVGTYHIHVVALPVLRDGSTYRAVEDITFEVVKDSETAVIDLTLERLPLEEMSEADAMMVAEQLGTSDTPEAQAAVDNARNAAGSNNNGNGGNSNTPAPSSTPAPNNGGNGGGASPAPNDPNAGKTWHEAVTEQRWVVDVPASQEPIYQDTAVCSCGLEFATLGAWDVHKQEIGRGSGQAHSYSVRSAVVGYNTIPEQGHYETVVIRAAGWY